MRRRTFIAGLSATIYPVAGLAQRAGSYRSVNNTDLVGGYIANGEWIETTGHIWFSDGVWFFNVDRVSARAPMRAEVSKVDSEAVDQLKSRCGAPNQFTGGCEATVRGAVGVVNGRKSILAHDIQIKPMP